VIDSDVNIADGLGMTGVRLEGVISGIDPVEVDVSVQQDVSPERVQEVGTVRSDDQVVFRASDIDEIISFEDEGLRDVGIEDGGRDGYVGPSVEGFIDAGVRCRARRRSMGMIK